MTSRERVLQAISHKEPDRIPMDLGGMDATTILAPAYARLRSKLGRSKGKFRIVEPLEQIPEIEEEAVPAFSLDALPLVFPVPAWKDARLSDGSLCQVPQGFEPEVLSDGSQIVRNERGQITHKMAVGSPSFKLIYEPLAGVQNVADLERLKDKVDTLDRPAFTPMDYEALGTEARRLYQTTAKAVLLKFDGHIFAGAQYLRGWENFMLDLAGNIPLAECLLDLIVEVHIARFEKMAAACQGNYDIVVVSDDLGTQEALQISPKLYRKVIKPRHERLYQFIKKRSGKWLFLHTDGAVRSIIPDLIEAGVDILNPVQVSARGMDTAELKKEFGKELTFWGGGCDSQSILPFGRPDEVKDEVKRRIEDLAPGGGFVFAPIHNIQPEVPPENVLAMYEAAQEFGKY